ncbi:unnamed protein product [Cuscuta europaea]|uniref:Reverse transcriptase zinc-binding domain-containing protein n=1 Tax=Cuscuta europaea TaxID=41803 RepID=A0A9P0ZMX1_CUSEU|nr:unnamed protein product [Cuscuta europaea]
MQSRYGKRALGEMKPTDSPIWRRLCLIHEEAETMVTRSTNSITWRHTTEGEFTSKSAYRALCPHGGRTLSNTQIWNPKQVPKIRVFLWKLWHKCLPFPEQVAAFSAVYPSRCPFCKKDSATQDHVLLLCPLSSSIWKFFSNLLLNGGKLGNSITLEIMKWWISNSGKTLDKVYMAILPGVITWHLWKAYWDSLWNDTEHETGRIIFQINKFMLSWCCANENLKGNDSLKKLGLLPESFSRRKPRIFRWEKPRQSHVKLNCSIFRGNGRSSA